jgi:integrase
VLLGAWCGMRCGEIIALKPEDIDLVAATVTVHENRVGLLESPVAFDAPPVAPFGRVLAGAYAAQGPGRPQSCLNRG